MVWRTRCRGYRHKWARPAADNVAQDSKFNTAREICFRLFVQLERRAASRADWMAGSSNATRMPMMAITTNNSTRVNPCWRPKGGKRPSTFRILGSDNSTCDRLLPRHKQSSASMISFLLKLACVRDHRAVRATRRIRPPDRTRTRRDDAGIVSVASAQPMKEGSNNDEDMPCLYEGFAKLRQHAAEKPGSTWQFSKSSPPPKISE